MSDETKQPDSDKTRQPGKARRPVNEWLSDAQTIAVFALLMIGVGLIVVFAQSSATKSTALLWAFGCLATGALGGFVFGIPRVEQGEIVAKTKAGDPVRIEPVTKRRFRLLANTNLEQISDWLTKIIVGVGLVEAKQIPTYLARLSEYVSRGVQPSAGGEIFALAITLHFSVWGFVSAYLMTRVYLTGAFFRAEGGNGDDVDDPNTSAGEPPAPPAGTQT